MDSTKLKAVFGSKKTLVALSASFGALAGSLATLKIVTTKFEEKYAAIAEAEIQQARQYYSVLNKEGKLADPVALLESKLPEMADEILDIQKYRTPPEEEVVELGNGDMVSAETVREAIEQSRNIFQDAKSAQSYFDYDVEVPLRSPDKPYIISFDEFIQEELEYATSTLTYFEEDGVLTDEHDEPVDIDDLLGDVNNLRFGHGSHDNNVVHIRNDALETDFEIVRSNSSFVRQVLGVRDDEEPVIKHSQRRFRERDDG